MTFRPGVTASDPAQPAATRALLKALRMSPQQAAAVAGVAAADVARLAAGHAHLSPADWRELADLVCTAAGAERDQEPPREMTAMPREIRAMERAMVAKAKAVA